MLGKLESYTYHPESAIRAFQKARKILRITHGPGHDLLSELDMHETEARFAQMEGISRPCEDRGSSLRMIESLSSCSSR